MGYETDREWNGSAANPKREASLAATPCSVESVNRQVIENQLLTALDDKSKVAILASEEDLDTLIAALLLSENNRMAMSSKFKELRADLQQLKSAAFPPNNY
ncbi:MAG: hypothetical protein M0Z71_12555 [Nitrospiraceae bacterium]|nr:hypothetical protein [Nitrospiraceae bacterium]